MSSLAGSGKPRNPPTLCSLSASSWGLAGPRGADLLGVADNAEIIVGVATSFLLSQYRLPGIPCHGALLVG